MHEEMPSIALSVHYRHAAYARTRHTFNAPAHASILRALQRHRESVPCS
jgi:hypothetical protein